MEDTLVLRMYGDQSHVDTLLDLLKDRGFSPISKREFPEHRLAYAKYLLYSSSSYAGLGCFVTSISKRFGPQFHCVLTIDSNTSKMLYVCDGVPELRPSLMPIEAIASSLCHKYGCDVGPLDSVGKDAAARF